PQGQRLFQQCVEHIDAAVALQFQHIFTGEGIRAGKEQRQAFVNDVARGGVMKRRVMRVAWLWLKVQEFFCNGEGKRAGDTHDTHTTSSWWCGYRTDGVVVSL